MKIEAFEVNDFARDAKHAAWLEFAPRADGGVWRLPALVVRGARAGPRLALFGGVHGDEYDGLEVIHRVVSRLNPAELRGDVIAVPVCNVAAYEVCARLSPVDGANLARVFPGRRDGTLTEQIAHWLTEKFIRGADTLIDIHSGGLNYAVPTLVGFACGDSPLRAANEAAARAFGGPVLWAHPGPLPPGRSLSAAEALDVPSMYTEAEGAGRVSDGVRDCFTDGVLNVMRHMRMLDGAPTSPASKPLELIGNGNLDHMISAPCAGHFRSDVRLLQVVTAGQRIGAVLDLLGHELAVVAANRDGVVITLRGVHRVNAGDGLAHITAMK